MSSLFILFYIIILYTDGDFKEKCEFSKVKQRKDEFKQRWVTGKISKYEVFN